jgi:hypothetical protein
VHRSFRHFVAALGAEFFARGNLRFALSANGSLFDFPPALGAEFDVAGKRCVATWTGGSDTFPPLLFTKFFILFSHLGMSPYLLNRAACLCGCHLNAQVRRASLAKPLLQVPAALAADPGGASRTLDEFGFNLVYSLNKGIITRLFPCCRMHPRTYIRRPTEDAADERARRTHDVRKGAGDGRLESGSKTRAAPVAMKLKLETLISAVVGEITNKFNFLNHEYSPRKVYFTSISETYNDPIIYIYVCHAGQERKRNLTQNECIMIFLHFFIVIFQYKGKCSV